MASITTIQSSDLISNSRTDINTNFANLNSDKIETSYLDTDTTLAANSDARIATQKATKAYLDAFTATNASTTAKGVVEEATDAEVVAGTDTGGTGAKLFVPPSKLNTQIATLTKSKKLYISTTEVTFTNGDGGAGAGTEQTLFSTTIPGGTLSTNNAVRFKFYVTGGGTNGSGTPWTFKVKYGGSTQLTAASPTPSNNQTGLSGIFEGYIIADGSASVQKMTLHGVLNSQGTEVAADASITQSKLPFDANAAGSIDSASDQTLEITLQQTNSANNDCVVEWFILEAIK